MVYTKLILIGIIFVLFVALTLIGFLAYRRRNEHTAIRVTGFILMALSGFLAVFIPASTLLLGYDEVCIAWTEGDAYFFHRDYLNREMYPTPSIVIHGSD